MPEDPVLDEIEGFFSNANNGNSRKLIRTAEEILKGDISFSGIHDEKIHMPFSIDDYISGIPEMNLLMARLEIPRILLAAYEVSGNDKFLIATCDMISSFASYEKNMILPKGLIWNDHAIAERISVLAKFWKYYRRHRTFNTEAGKAVLLLVSRSGRLLSKPSHFTFASNHGIMQNLALLQICIAFPAIPNVNLYKETSLDRMSDQMKYYVNNEGIVLEHSAGYQRAGIKFMGMLFQYLTSLNIKIPDEWQGKYENAKLFYAQLRRPDGSLPMYGDTAYWKDSLGPPIVETDPKGKIKDLSYHQDWRPLYDQSLYPVAGYSIWWDGLGHWPDDNELSQTSIVWSYFPGHAHKHADEMSVLIYAKGHSWWTNTGYWSYGNKNRSKAISWNGSNAPHLVNEDAESNRVTNLNCYVS
ncbi:MAG: heparinase II/III family protein, partial [Nitrospirota bacterium]